MSQEGAPTSENNENIKLVRFLKMSYSRVLAEQVDSTSDDREKIAIIAQNALTKSTDVVESDFPSFKLFVTKCTSQFEGTAEEFVKYLAENVSDYFLSSQSLDSIAQKMRNNTLERNGLIGVGDILCYKFLNETTLSLHLTPMFLDDPMSFLRILRADIKKFAESLVVNDTLSDVSSISVESPIVEKLKNFLISLGFKDFQHDEETGVTKAVADRELFLACAKEKLDR